MNKEPRCPYAIAPLQEWNLDSSDMGYYIHMSSENHKWLWPRLNLLTILYYCVFHKQACNHARSLKETGQVRWLATCILHSCLTVDESNLFDNIFIMWCWRESWRVESMTLRGLIESSTLHTTTRNVNSKGIPPCKAKPHQKFQTRTE